MIDPVSGLPLLEPVLGLGNTDSLLNLQAGGVVFYGPDVAVNGATVRNYDLATGELLWECGGHTAGAIPMPAIGHGMVFTASGWRKDTLHAIALGQRGDLTDSESVVWSLTYGALVFDLLVVAGLSWRRTRTSSVLILRSSR